MFEFVSAPNDLGQPFAQHTIHRGFRGLVEMPGLRLTVRDDGQGFDLEQTLHQVQRQNLGLVGLRERVKLAGGTLRLTSTPGEGTVLEAIFPASTLQQK